MRKILTIILASTFILTGFLSLRYFLSNRASGAPPYGESEENVPGFGIFSWLDDWERPEGPAKVALQVGHWKNEELPEELDKLRGSSGATGGGRNEWEVNLAIAEETAKLLKKKGVEVEILPATIPPSYWADVFIAIHADGSTDTTKAGFKIASPWRDFTRKAKSLVDNLYGSYSEATNFTTDDNITRNMRGYYAFSWWRYEHAIHPMATAAIIETGFLTNPLDRRILIDTPEIPAEGIADGIFDFLVQEGLLENI